MPNIFHLSSFTLAILAPLAVSIALVVSAFKSKGYNFPRAILALQVRLYLACLILVNCAAAWCFVHSGYDLALATENQDQFHLRSLIFLLSNLLLILICSVPLFSHLQARLFQRQISLIQIEGVDRGLFLALNCLSFAILTALLAPVVQYFLVHHGWLRGNDATLTALFHIDCLFSFACLVLAAIAISCARAPEAVRTMRTLRDEDLLPDYLAKKTDRELYPLMAAAQGLLQLNRAEALKAIDALTHRPEAEKQETEQKQGQEQKQEPD